MTTPDPARWVQQAALLARQAADDVLRDRKGWHLPPPSRRRPEFARHAVGLDWQGLGRTGRELVQEADRALTRLADAYELVGARLQSLTAAAALESVDARPLGRLPAWRERRSTIRGFLVEQGAHRAQIEDFVERLEEQSAAGIVHESVRELAGCVAGLDRDSRTLLATLAAGRLARAVATLNLTAGDPGCIDTRSLATHRRGLIEGVTAVRQTLREGGLACSAAAWVLADAAATAVEVAATQAAHCAAARPVPRFRPHRRDAAAREAAELGQLAVWCEVLARAVVLTLPVALTGLAGALVDPYPARPATDPPHSLDLALWRTDPASLVGAVVTVEGVLSSLTHTRAGSSGVVILSGGTRLPVRVDGVRLETTGAVPGAALRFTAEVVRRDGAPVLAVRRRPPGDEPAAAWSAAVQHALREAYQLAPEGLDLLTSWEPGPDGAVNALVYGAWQTGGEDDHER